MTDEPLLDGLGEPRPLPDALRARLVRALLAGPEEEEGLLRDIDVPRRVPTRARHRLEGAIAGQAAEIFATLDAPRELPASLRARVQRALAPSAVLPMRARAIAAAAVTVLFVASSVMVQRSGGDRTDGEGRAAPPPPATEQGRTVPGRTSLGGTEAEAPIGPPAPALPPALAGGLGAGAGFSRGAPPPFAFGAPALVVGPAPSPAIRGAALRVGIVGGDDAQEVGFRSYVALLNAEGGVAGHDLVVVEGTPDDPPARTVTTVNLSGEALATEEGAPDWVRGALIETLAVPDALLRGDVFGFASGVERQAHLAVDVVFPEPADGAIAIVYHGSDDVFGDRVPRALEEVLEARGVTPIRIAYDGGPAVLVPADAAFLSMDAAAARAFLEQARDYAPARGITGIWTVADASLAAMMRDGTRALSPYRLTGNAGEVDEIERRTGRAASAALVHGWTAAKTIAVAIWGSGADTASEVRAALVRMTGYDNGFAPDLAWRADTRSRTPDAIVLEARDGKLVRRGGFRRDGFPAG